MWIEIVSTCVVIVTVNDAIYIVMWIEIDSFYTTFFNSSLDAIYIVMWIEILRKTNCIFLRLDAIYIVMWIEIQQIIIIWSLFQDAIYMDMWIEITTIS